MGDSGFPKFLGWEAYVLVYYNPPSKVRGPYKTSREVLGGSDFGFEASCLGLVGVGLGTSTGIGKSTWMPFRV